MEPADLKSSVADVITEVQRALDKTWVDIEQATEKRYKIRRCLNEKPWTRTYEARVEGGGGLAHTGGPHQGHDPLG